MVLRSFVEMGRIPMPKYFGRVLKAYNFFCEAESSKRLFSLEEVCKETGWTIQTVQSYRSKKWHWFLKESHGSLLADGICICPKEVFFDIHAQRVDIRTRSFRPKFGSRVDNLIDKARESALLAIQAYNNPLAVFRTPGYLVLMNIAFTALFHAIFERDAIDYSYKDIDGSPKIIDGETAAWELGKCADYYYKGAYNAERANLDFLNRLRNKIEHRFIPTIDANVAGQCQAMLFNFEDLLRNEFGGFFALDQSLALPLIFTDMSDHQKGALKRKQSKEYDLIYKFIKDFQKDLPTDIQQSQKYSFRVFLIPRLGNHATSSDISIEFIHYDPSKPDEMEHYEKQVAMIKEKFIQVANQGKLKPLDVVHRVKAATGKPFSIPLHTSAWRLYKVRSSTRSPQGCKVEFCQYDEAHGDFVYTEKWVEFLIKKVNNPDEFEKLRNYRGKVSNPN